MSTRTEKFPLDEVAEGRIDDQMFHEFLAAYGYYWHHCHAEGHINAGDLYDAGQNAIKYAREKGFRLEFGEMDYKLEPLGESANDQPAGTECSCYAPTYLELSLKREESDRDGVEPSCAVPGVSHEERNMISDNDFKPPCPLIGADGNIYHLLGIASRTLKAHGFGEKAEAMCGRAKQSQCYDEALAVILEYVDPVTVGAV